MSNEQEKLRDVKILYFIAGVGVMAFIALGISLLGGFDDKQTKDNLDTSEIPSGSIQFEKGQPLDRMDTLREIRNSWDKCDELQGMFVITSTKDLTEPING